MDTKKICALYGCDKEVTNWRISCCCYDHQRKHAAKKRHKTENQPSQSIAERKAYINEYMNRHPRKLYVPAWANKQAIRNIYKEAKQLSIDSGVLHEVDHIIPIKGKLVSGLHCEANLQILTKTENRSKINKFSDQ